jgi:hypothetical protein
MPLDKTPTIRSRELGRELRAGLRAANMTAARVSEVVGWNPSTFTRLMLGERKAREIDLATVLGVLRIHGAERDRLLALGREYYSTTWLQEFEHRLPPRVPTLADLEANAEDITLWAPDVVPELLQTHSYARALLSSATGLPRGELELRIDARVERQRRLLGGGHPVVLALLRESVLTRDVGGPRVLSEQREHLRWLAARPNVVVRIVPDRYGAQTTQNGAFTRLRSSRYSTVIGLQTEVSALFLERESHVAAYDRVVAALERQALDGPTSLGLMEEGTPNSAGSAVETGSREKTSLC